MRPTNKQLSAKEALYQRGLLHCAWCQSDKTIDAFGAKADGFHEKQRYCKPCLNAKQAQYQDTPEYRAKRLESQRRRRAERPRPTPEQNRRANLWRLYKITPEGYDRMLAAQGGRCAICRRADPQTPSGVFHVDHCHDTDVVRGLLCNYCNPALGAFQDSEHVLLAAIEYLRRHRGHDVH